MKTSDAKLFLIKLQQEDGKSYSSIHTIRGVLRPAFQMAVDDDILVKNPFGFQLAGVLVNDAVTREAISKDQMRKFLKFVHDDVVYCKYYEVVYILFHTGMRISEFCGLTLKDIDLENRTINIDHQLQRTSDMRYIIETTKTDAGTRVLPITEDVAQMFQAIIEDRNAPKVEKAIDGYSGFLFYDDNGMPLVAMHWQHRFNGMCSQGRSVRQLNSKIRIGLSGTPMNKAEDLWNILTWLRVEKRNFYQFKNRYCIMGGFNGYKVVAYRNLDELNKELNTVMLRRKKEDVLDLPPKIYTTEHIELTRKQRILYKEIRQGIVDNLDNILEIPNPLSCTVRLRQLTGGLFGDDNPKLERVKDMLEEITESGHKALIFSQWEQVTAVYKEALKDYNPAYIVGAVDPEDRQKEVDKFQNDPTCKVAIGTIGAMGTGLTMTAASYVFFIDKRYWDAENKQAEDRAHRIGTTNTVKRLLRALYKMSRIPERYCYNIPLVPEGKDLGAFEALNNFMKNVEEKVENGEGLYIWSECTGNGKTSWACKILSYYFRKVAFKSGLENEGLYIYLPTFLDDLRQSYDEPDADFSELLDMLKNCKLLVIDDIGAEKSTEWVNERLLSIINTRMMKGLSTVYTSNCSLEDIGNRMGERISSRIRGSATEIHLVGQDRRGCK